MYSTVVTDDRARQRAEATRAAANEWLVISLSRLLIGDMDGASAAVIEAHRSVDDMSNDLARLGGLGMVRPDTAHERACRGPYKQEVVVCPCGRSWLIYCLACGGLLRLVTAVGRPCEHAYVATGLVP